MDYLDYITASDSATDIENRTDISFLGRSLFKTQCVPNHLNGGKEILLEYVSVHLKVLQQEIHPVPPL